MFPPVLQEIKGYFGTVFLLGVFLPVLLFAGISITLYIDITQGVENSISIFINFPIQFQIIAITGGAIAVIVMAVLIYNFQFMITRLFEGYWPRISILQKLRDSRTELHRRQWEYLESLKLSANTDTEQIEIVEEQLALYPPPNHLEKFMPTNLGNILRASEIYAFDHYGIDSSIIWTRLRPLLPEQVVTPLENNMIAIDFLLLMSVLATIFTLIWCIVLAIFTNRWVLFLVCSFGWPLAWICYRSAVQSAIAYSEQLKAIFDLYRHSLLEALKFPIPTNAEAEFELWEALSEFFNHNIPISTDPPQKPSSWELFNPLIGILRKIIPNGGHK